MQPWRVLPLITTSGAMQMAIDTWLLEQHRRGYGPSSLRFYAWSPVALSLGYHQYRYPDTWHQLEWNGCPVDLVRRPSGGRAVLHQGDLTYAIVTSEKEILGIKGDRRQPGESQRSYVYRTLCQFLIDGMQSLGIDLHYGHAGRGYIHNPNCFGTATTADLILSDGTKLIGSAQLKRGNSILQHGSIRIHPDSGLFQEVFGLGPGTAEAETGENVGAEGTEETEDVSQNLKSSLQNCSIETIISALTTAADQCFGIDGTVQPLSPQEWDTILTQSQKWHIPNHHSSTNLLG
ncbi:MAG: lipoate--protein ligase family protein [Merismopedia sp. SIO2A8]|nr:lipoate--protein ligase family protein [Symploca sp. SIO2B6]NET49472.1 lipoate--protein ligase family protein [Merismopedia sp. SIO2A8]